MAKLILTDEEKKSASFLDWDDDALGKAVKNIALIFNDDRGEDTLKHLGAVSFMIARCIDLNAEQGKVKVEGLTQDGEPLGDWEIEVRKCR